MPIASNVTCLPVILGRDSKCRFVYTFCSLDAGLNVKTVSIFVRSSVHSLLHRKPSGMAFSVKLYLKGNN